MLAQEFEISVLSLLNYTIYIHIYIQICIYMYVYIYRCMIITIRAYCNCYSYWCCWYGAKYCYLFTTVYLKQCSFLYFWVCWPCGVQKRSVWSSGHQRTKVNKKRIIPQPRMLQEQKKDKVKDWLPPTMELLLDWNWTEIDLLLHRGHLPEHMWRQGWQDITMYIYIYIYMNLYTCIHIYIYIYIDKSPIV